MANTLNNFTDDTTTDGVDVREKIRLKVFEVGMNITSLARQVDISEAHCRFVFTNKERPLSQQLLDKINHVLNTDFKLDGK